MAKMQVFPTAGRVIWGGANVDVDVTASLPEPWRAAERVIIDAETGTAQVGINPAVASEIDGADTLAAVAALPAVVAAVAAHEKAALKAYAGDRRWLVETAGVAITLGGVTVVMATDEASITKLKTARDGLRDGDVVDANGDPLETVEVVIGQTAATLDEAAITAAIRAGIRHVQQAYAAQSAVYAAIDAGTITTIQQIDAADWPALPGQ